MIKLISFALLLIFPVVNIFSQDCSCLLINRLNDLKLKKDYKQMFEIYDSISQFKKPTIINYSTAANISLELNDSNKFMHYLYLAIMNQEFNSLGNLRYNIPSIEAYTNIKELTKKFDSLYIAWTPQLNLQVTKSIDEIINSDQYIRNIYNSFTSDSASLYLISKIMGYTDSINELKLREITKILGYFPGIEEIGNERLRKLIIISVHFVSRMDTAFYFPYSQKSILNNNLYPQFFPLIIDRYHSRYDEPTIYGLAFKYEGEKKTFHPISDIKNVDNRRKYFCLPTLKKENLLNSNIELPAGYEEKNK